MCATGYGGVGRVSFKFSWSKESERRKEGFERQEKKSSSSRAAEK